MFDIKKAAMAALGTTRDRTRRTGFVRFLERASETDIPACQWRTVGGDADIIEKFLTEAGFTADDYSVDISRLDPSVRTFRWGSTGMYDKLRHALADAAKEFSSGGDGDLFTAMAFRVSAPDLGDEDICAGLGGTIQNCEAAEPDGTQERGPLDFGAVTASRYTEYNEKFPDDRIVPGDEAVPDLSVIERICRGLRGTALSGAPEEPVFAANPDGRQIRTVMRHFGAGEELQYVNIYAGTVVPAVFQCSCADDGSDNPFKGYLYRDVETCSKVDTRHAAGVVLFGCEEVCRDAYAYAFTSNPKALREYVRGLYAVFFKVPPSCVGLTAWSSVTYPCLDGNGAVAEPSEGVVKAAGILGMDPRGLVTYKYCVTIANPDDPSAGVPGVCSDGLMGSDCSGGIIASDSPVGERSCASKGVLSEDLEGEWYDCIHRPRCYSSSGHWRDIGDANGDASEGLAKARRDWHRRRTARALCEDASFDDNRALQFRQLSSASPAAGFLVHMGIAIRATADADGIGIVRAVHKDRPGEHLVSRVLTSVVSPEDTPAPEVTADPARLSKYLDEALAGQITGRKVDASTYVYRLTVETNVRFERPLPAESVEKLRRRIAEWFATDLVYGHFKDGLRNGTSFSMAICGGYRFESRYFRAGVSSDRWLGYDPDPERSVSGPLTFSGRDLLGGMLKVGVGTDEDGRVTVIIDVSRRARNAMMTGIRTHMMIPPVDAYGVATLSEDNRSNLTSRTVACNGDTRRNPDVLQTAIATITRTCNLTPETGWTQAEPPYHGRGRMFCHLEYDPGVFCPGPADVRRGSADLDSFRFC